ncbi:MAG: Omp28-related outer membrane protein [Bacteroidetes bacterium]|nr:Omp28-related outer membrane protein [Bacteroidota bacterium]
MKKLLFTLFGILGVIFVTSGQTLVTTQPQNKNVVLEDYTGIHCQYCPQGHVIAQSILDNNPGRAAVISIHQGGYAAPNAGEPDYRTPFGDALAGQTGLTGYPSGTVNRHVFIGGVTALGRGDWTNASNTTLAEISPVNVGLTSDIDTVTRLLTVHVELYYTANSATTTNYINVALIQDHIFGPQTGAPNPYEHMHMLRFLVTGQWGDAVSTTTAGSLVERTYTYTVPAGYNSVPCVLSDCQVVAFVTESHQEIPSGDVVNAIGGTNLYIGDITTSDSTMLLGYPASVSTFNLQANSNLTGTESFVVKISDNAPTDWAGNFNINGTDYSDSAVVSLTKGTPKDIVLNVTPGDSSGFYCYTLELKSVSNPKAPSKYFKVYVISNVNTMLVNAAGDDNATSRQAVYLNALQAAGSSFNAVMSSDLFVRASQAKILPTVQDIFYNVAWTFPAFTDPEALAVKAFINAGGDVFVGGQDIGWDIMSDASGSHGTPEAKDLYTNYLQAQFIDDGSTANNKWIAKVGDSIFGTVATSNVVDVNGGNMYPDQIAPLGTATPIFYYNTALTKISGLRAMKGSAKIIYFGIGLEMIQTVAVTNDIVNRAWHWFMGYTLGINENSVKSESLSQNVPNPCNMSTSIRFTLAAPELVSLDLYDMSGRTVQSVIHGNLTEGDHQVNISTSSLNAGVYYYTLQSASGKLTRKMIVVK